MSVDGDANVGLLDDPNEALQVALTSQGWTAARVPGGLGRLRLAGEQIDGRPWLATELLVPPGSALLRTRLPVTVLPWRRDHAARLVSAINGNWNSVISVDRQGVPEVCSKLYLFPPHEFAAETIVDGVHVHRAAAAAVTQALDAIARGASPSSVGAELEFDDVPYAQPRRVAALVDLSGLPGADPDVLEAWRESMSGRPDAEVVALAELWTLNLQLEDAPHCGGPVLVHADGVLECYGCANPNANVHPPGTSASCGPGRRLGYGHGCIRCGTENTRPTPSAPEGFRAAIAQLREMLPSWTWEQEAPTSWIAAVDAPEKLGLRVSGPRGPEMTVLRADVLLAAIAIPAEARAEAALFCALANRFFAHWNLFLQDYEHDSRMISAATFLATQSWSSLPASLVVTHTLTAIRAATVAAPALRAVTQGMDARNALALADRTDDTIDMEDILR